MKLESQLSLRPDFLYLAPLFNVVLLLLLFFLLNSNLVVRSGYRVETPVSRSSLKPVERSHLLTVTAGDDPSIYFNDQRIYPADLLPLLQNARRESRYVLINADRSVPFDFVQRLINRIQQAGCEPVVGTSMAD